MIRKIWNNISNLGIAYATTNSEIIYTKLCNQFAIIFALTSVEYIFVFRFLGYPHQGNLLLLVIISYLTPLLFNYWGYLFFARFLAIFVVSTAITIFTAFFGTSSSIPHLCYALMVTPLLFYDLKNRNWLILTILVGMLPIFLCRLFFQKPMLSIPEDVTLALSMFLKFTTASTLIIIIFYFARNVSAEQEKQKILYSELQKSDKYKSEFFANVSHELRTPMTAIIGFTDILIKRNPGVQEKDYLQIIKSSGENLLRIINDILDISKMESGKMIFEENPISIKELFSSLKNMMLPRALEKNLTLIFEYPTDIPDVILGDPTRLTQIIINILGNALKFTEKGSITISVKVLKEENDQFLFGFSIQDTGVGIAEDKLKYIFERFRQAEAYTTRHYGGTGLGLSIAKQLVELQGGTILVKSKLGVGSDFIITLPFKKYTVESTYKKSVSRTLIDYEKMKRLQILLVEDNPINIKFVQSLFSEYAIKVDVAEDGEKAVEKLKNKEYDVVLMDIEMPNMNGFQTTEVIRKELKNTVPIIAMTANAMAGEKEKCIAIGMSDYISKPVSTELLFEKLNSLSIAKYGITEPAKPIETPEKLITLDFLIENIGNKEADIVEIIDIFCMQLPQDMADLSVAIVNTDYHNIKQYTHRMKSTLSLLGVNSMLSISNEIEAKGREEKGIEEIRELHRSLVKCFGEVLKEAQEEKNKLMAS